MARRSISKAMRARIAKRFGNCCAGTLRTGERCAVALPSGARCEVDHIVPLALGGPDTEDNMQPLCEPCHARKTRGNGATTAGSDLHAIRKAQRHAGERKGKKFRMKLPTRKHPRGRVERRTT